MRRLALILMFALCASFAQAQDFSDPVALITDIYKAYTTDIESPGYGDVYSKRLQALRDSDGPDAPDGDGGKIDWDVFVNGNDWQLSKLTVTLVSRNIDDVNEFMENLQATGAFEQLVERHQRLVIGTVGRMLGSGSDAEDIAQQVFVRVWKNAKRYEPRAKFTTWLLKITRNLVFNELRRRSRHPQVPLQSESDEEERPLKDEQAIAPDASLLEHELQQAVDAAIANLPETQRMAVVLRRYEELSYEEIAEALDQSVSAVKSLLFRARTELRESLQRYLSS